ncbi:MAG: hypothetical protein KC503_01230 [Myxococcales bacterium]|nr:hypothetical protein [Myxococcales bacterium]
MSLTIRLPFAVPLLLVLCALPACNESPALRDATSDGGPRDATSDRQRLEAAPDFLLPDAPPLESDRCGGGDTIDTSKATVEIDDSTSGANNQYGEGVRCGGPTPFAGPQRYYRLDLDEKKTYRITLAPKFEGVAYLFQTCARDLINADCSSGGRTGAATGLVAAGGSGRIVFFPPASGTYVLAVDSVSAAQSGDYKLTVETFSQPPNAACASAQPIALANGSVAVQANTLGARDEFGTDVQCGLGLDLDGPNLYYSVDLKGGQWYRIALDAQFEATAYIAGAAGGCQAANIEQDCSGITGNVLPGVAPGKPGIAAFRAPADGTYIVAIDSVLPKSAGPFAMSIEAFSPAGNMICDNALPVSLVGGVALVRGDTTGALNDRGAQMQCGAPPLTGPQAYYSVSLVKDQPYLLTLTTAWPSLLAVGSDCLTLPSDCTNALNGGSVLVPAGSEGKLFFTPTRDGTHLVAVEGTAPDAFGPFKLVIAEASGAAGGSCQSPQQLTVPAGGTLTVAGNTGPLSNDISGVDCGNTAGPWPGPQAYYRVTLAAGKSYTITLTPEATFDPALYAFVATTSCDASSINGACTATSSDQSGVGVKETLTIAPPTTTDYVIVVDSWSLSEVGTFALEVRAN